MTVQILEGHVLDRLAELKSESVHCVVTSPPYYGLRAYGTEPQVWGSWVGELGSEPTPDLFIDHLVTIFREVRRVLRSDATCWLNIGDSYAGSGKGPTGHNGIGDQGERQGFVNDRRAGRGVRSGTGYELQDRGAGAGCKPKDLIGIPWMLAFALRADGWWLRSNIRWCLSGGTQIYVRSQKGDMSMSVKDMSRLRSETMQVWNGARWTRVVRMWESEDAGDPIEIELRSGERIGCTPNHLWPTARGLLRAADLRVGDVFERVKLPEPDVPRRPSALDDADVGWFIGLYLAEGSRDSRALHIAGHVKEVERFDRVARIAEAFDGRATMRRSGKGSAAVISVYGRILRAIVDEYISGERAHGKHMTNACWRRSDVFLRGLLDGYLHGDGHWDEQNSRWRLGFARNYEFAADLRTICARLGVSLRLRPRFATLDDRRFPTFRGEIRFARNGGPYEKSDNEIVCLGFSRGRKFWDIEVEDEPHTFALASGVLTHNCKRAPMPESVLDRPTSAVEDIFLLSKSPRYYYDHVASVEPAVSTHASGNGYARPEQISTSGRGQAAGWQPAPDRRMRNFWLLGPEPFPESHFATFVSEVPRRCIVAGTSERGCCPNCGAPWQRQTEKAYVKSPAHGAGSQTRNRAEGSDTNGWAGLPRVALETTTVGWSPSCDCPPAEPVPCVVLDPFFGAGTTGLVADRLGRDAVGIELQPEYAAMARRRIAGDAPMFTSEVVS